MTPELKSRMKKAELSIAMMTWTDTPYRTIRSLTNEQAAERAVQVVEEFLDPLLASIGQVLDSFDQESLQRAIDGLAAAYRDVTAESGL